jgi:isopentenyl diphosphate isomerase/L-lactate dehydrogenase-like FMN-dependent dehydrogenase
MAKAKKTAGKKQDVELTRTAGREDHARPFNTLQEMVIHARQNLSRFQWDTLCGGSDSETTLRRNRMAIDCLALRQRVLVDVSKIDMTTTLLGEKLKLPVFIAPVGNFLQIADPAGAVAVARGAVAAGTTAFISTAAKPSIEEVAKSVDHPLLFQLYVRSDRAWMRGFLDRAKAAGYRAICVTVDRAYYSRRERDIINQYLQRADSGDPRHQASLTWDDCAWIKQHTKLPLILKGIATAEDAKRAVQIGADVVYVSNHGGRQLDHGQGTIETLPEIVAAVKGKAEVLWDGGVTRGTDVVKAIALGARAVGVGKLQGWALAAGGEQGIVRMFELLAQEIHTTLGLMGVKSLKELNPSWVTPAIHTGKFGTTCNYPVFDEMFKNNQ